LLHRLLLGLVFPLAWPQLDLVLVKVPLQDMQSKELRDNRKQKVKFEELFF
jgi:hypothetical protein